MITLKLGARAAVRSLFRAAILLVAGVALGQGSEAPTDMELRKLLNSYRATEAPLRMIRIAAEIQAGRGLADQAEYLRCMDSRLSSEILSDILLPVARQEFPSGKRVQELVAFFQSPTGQKMLDQIAATLPRMGVDPSARGSLELRPQDFSFTPAEVKEMQAMEDTLAYLDLKAFGRRIRTLLLRESDIPELKAIQNGCKR